MSIIPSVKVLHGTGKPRLIKEMKTALFTSSTSTTYTATTVTVTAGTPDLSVIKLNMGITSRVNNPDPTLAPKTTYAKVTAVNNTTKVITVDGWTNGTPTNGNIFYVNLWIADLPRSENLTETFEPILLIHELRNGTTKTKHRGYKYSCSIDYSSYISGDTLYAMQNQLHAELSGDTKNLILIPRRDEIGFNYKVYLGDAMELTMHPSKLGMKGFAFNFIGKENVASLGFKDGYGWGYATLYGTGL